MRPVHYSVSPVGSSQNGFANDVTGLTWVLTNTTTTDGLGHIVSILNNSIVDYSSVDAVLIGTDADGNPQTETMALPEPSSTSSSLNYYSTLTSVVPGSTIGSDTMDIGWSADALGKTIPSEWRSNSGAGIDVDISGTINYTVQETFANIYDAYPSTLPWSNITDLTSSSVDAQGVSTLGVEAIRLKINSVTTGATVDIYLSQPNGYGS